MKDEIIELFKAKAELRKLKDGIKTEKDLANYFFGQEAIDAKQREIDARKDLKNAITKNKDKFKESVIKSKDKVVNAIVKNRDIVVKAGAGALAVVILSGCIFAGCNAMIKNDQESVDTTNPIGQTTTVIDGNYKTRLSQEEVLQIAEKALAKVEAEMVDKGVRPMGDPNGPYFPEWFNAEMLATIVLLESSNRVTEEDGSPLYGKPVKINGATQRARGICQILPDTLDYIHLLIIKL